MSTLTSVFGMLPLVVLSGRRFGTLSRLGSVVVGGLALSALLTLIIIPPMLSMIVEPLESAPAPAGEPCPGRDRAGGIRSGFRCLRVRLKAFP